MPEGIKNNINIPKGSFSERLRFLMDAHGFDQAALAAQVGVSQGSISRYLKGREPRGEILLLLCQLFAVHPNELLPIGIPDKSVENFQFEGESTDFELSLAIARLKKLKERDPNAFLILAQLLAHLSRN